MTEDQKKKLEEFIVSKRNSIKASTPVSMCNVVHFIAESNRFLIPKSWGFNWEWLSKAYQIVTNVKLALINADDELAEVFAKRIGDLSGAMPEMETAYNRHKDEFTELEQALFEKELEWWRVHGIQTAEKFIEILYYEQLIYGRLTTT